MDMDISEWITTEDLLCLEVVSDIHLELRIGCGSDLLQMEDTYTCNFVDVLIMPSSVKHCFKECT